MLARSSLEDTMTTYTHKKMISVTIHQRNSNQNYKTSPHTP